MASSFSTAVSIAAYSSGERFCSPASSSSAEVWISARPPQVYSTSAIQAMPVRLYWAYTCTQKVLTALAQELAPPMTTYRPFQEILAEALEHDPDLRAEWDRTQLARE